ncbi:malate dehydrogenase, mitochondrial-like [Lucilia cuprina]|uniref:malate dehydrogenase, mitochondrial-like n=1 Tax=Lucilia cuprina TaxID=7375 RepID=UPI001F05CE77|nr:malate dehydrogenase, mitochondrial-like [Lucilia cuprina]
MWSSLRRLTHTSAPLEMCKICILGADGGIGRHLALKLKLNKNITDLALYDMADTKGVREDLSHIDTMTQVFAYSGEKALVESLKCSNIVVVLAGQAHSPKFSSREAMFGANAELMINFMKATVEACPHSMPFIHIVTNPVNALVPLCAEYLKDVGYYNPKKLIGSSSVDTMRARTFLGQVVGCDPSKLIVPVVGGHSAGSITPLVSQSKPRFELDKKVQQQLEDRIVHGAGEVVKAKKTQGAAQLAMGHCVANFCDSICRAINGEKNVVEVGYVPADVNELEFFACNFTVDKEGITECHRLPPMSEYETELFCKAVKDVQNNITTAKEFYKKYKAEKCK